MITEGHALTDRLTTQLTDRFENDCASELACEIAYRDSDTLQLIGLSTECENAVFWEPGMYDVIRVPITSSGLDGLAWRHLSTIEDEEELEACLDGVGGVYFAWISPVPVK